MNSDQLQTLVGTLVRFTGFTADDDELPPNNEALIEGEEYEMVGFTPEDEKNEASAVVRATNPNFNPDKRASSKANPRTVDVVVFLDEFAVPEANEQGEEVALDAVDEDVLPATEEDGQNEDQEKEQDEEQQDVVAEEPVKTPATAKRKTAAKKSTKKATKAVEPKAATAAEKNLKDIVKESPVPAKAATKKRGPKKATAKQGEAEAAAKKTAAKKDEEDEDLKDLVIFEEGQEDEEIVTMVQEADDLCALVEELAEETAYSEFRLGGALYHLRLTKQFRSVKGGQYDVQGGFGEYVAAELNLGYRKAMNLVQIYQEFTRRGLTGDDVSRIKWTKASVIATASSRLGDDLDEDGLNKLLEVAEESTADDLRATIKETYSNKGGEAGDVVRKITFKFRLTEQEAEITRQGLEGAKALLNTKDEAAAFAHIVAEWATENLDAPGADEVAHGSARGVGRGKKKTAEAHQEA